MQQQNLFLWYAGQPTRIFEPMSSLQFAIIGCGKIAPRHAREAAKWGVLAAVCDPIPERADALARAYNSRSYYSIEALFQTEKNIQVTAICTPNGLHTAHSILALNAGSHVLCEKPLCIAAADGVHLLQAAQQNQRKLFVVKSTRYNPAIAALKKMIADGKTGQLYSFQLNCFWNRPATYYADSWKGGELDGGTLYTQFSHYIDALLWLLGDIKKVTGFRKNLAHPGMILSEDSGAAALELESGVIGGINWSVNSYRENMEVSLTLLAEKATIRLGGAYMNEISYQLAEDFTLNIPATGSANDYGHYKGSMSNHDQVYENLVKALADPTHPFTSAADGLKTVEAIERIYNSVSLS